MNRFTLAIAVLVSAVVVARLVSEAALKVLSAEQKGLLIERMAPVRKFGLLAVVLFAFLGFKAPLLVPVGVVGYLVVHQAFVFLQVKHLSLPTAYLRASLIAAAITVAGIGAYVYVIFAPART